MMTLKTIGLTADIITCEWREEQSFIIYEFKEKKILKHWKVKF